MNNDEIIILQTISQISEGISTISTDELILNSQLPYYFTVQLLKKINNKSKHESINIIEKAIERIKNYEKINKIYTGTFNINQSTSLFLEIDKCALILIMAVAQFFCIKSANSSISYSENSLTISIGNQCTVIDNIEGLPTNDDLNLLFDNYITNTSNSSWKYLTENNEPSIQNIMDSDSILYDINFETFKLTIKSNLFTNS